MVRRTVAVLMLAAAMGWFAPSSRGNDSIHAFDVAVAKGRVAPALRILKVPHQADVMIAWSVDQPMTIHLEGYDISVFANPGEPQVMRFKAFATGRFPVHAHAGDRGEGKKHAHGHGALLRLEVHPR